MIGSSRCARVALAWIILLAGLASARAAEDRCIAVAEAPGNSYVHRARYEAAALKPGEVHLSYIGHSTFLIESSKGIRIATDYNDYVRPAAIPDIATMNRAHSTHFTLTPDPAIRHVLKGWNP
jgi:hypothetical protein